MPRVPAHLREHALGMLQGDVRTADVAKEMKGNVCTVSCLRQHYRETGRTADRPRSGRPRVTTPAQDRYIRTSQLRTHFYLQWRPIPAKPLCTALRDSQELLGYSLESNKGVCSDTSSTEMQCLRPLCHSGAHIHWEYDVTAGTTYRVITYKIPK